MKYNVGDKVWITTKAIEGNYIGPATIIERVQDNHYIVRLPVKCGDKNEFLVFSSSINYMLEK